jgi:hypothetical protein
MFPHSVYLQTLGHPHASSKQQQPTKESSMKKSAQQKKISKVMKEYGAGKLHGGVNPKGPKKAPVVKNRKQAIAIALSSAGVKQKKKSK